MKKERILLLSGNYHPEPTGIGKFNYEMIEWLSEQGYECCVITTYPYYPFWEVQAPYTNKSSWYKKEQHKLRDDVFVKIYRCPHYVPKIPCGKKRVFSDLSFFISAFFRILAMLFEKKYDYVITVAPPFQLGLLGLIYKKIKGAKIIYHVQDLQIDAAYELGLIKSKFLLRMMFGFEKFFLRKSDFVSSISEGMIRKIKSKYNRHVILFPNWAETKIFHPIPDKAQLKELFDFSYNDKIVLYSGAIGEKQGLQTLLCTAKELSFRKDITFLICGSGPYKKRLIELAKEMDLQNVLFLPLQPREKFNQFLNMVDVHLVLQKANANDLMMPSKLATILSVGGLALVTAEPETSLHSMIASHKMGLVIEPDNHLVLTSSIVEAIDKPFTNLKKNARMYAENYLAIDKVISRFFSQIMELEDQENIPKRMKSSLKVNVKAN